MTEHRNTPLQNALERLVTSGRDPRENEELWKAILHVCWQAEDQRRRMPMLTGSHLTAAVQQLELELVSPFDMADA